MCVLGSKLNKLYMLNMCHFCTSIKLFYFNRKIKRHQQNPRGGGMPVWERKRKETSLTNQTFNLVRVQMPEFRGPQRSSQLHSFPGLWLASRSISNSPQVCLGISSCSLLIGLEATKTQLLHITSDLFFRCKSWLAGKGGRDGFLIKNHTLLMQMSLPLQQNGYEDLSQHLRDFTQNNEK